MNVLVVDDIAANRLALQAIFERQGYTVIEATDGLEGLEALGKGGIDAIVSDILMPRMDGYRFCYEVRENPKLRHLPFVFYTAGYTSPKDRKLAMEMGADKFLVKPASAEEILRALSEAACIQRGQAKDADPGREINLLKEHNQQLSSKLAEKHFEITRLDEEMLQYEQRLLLQSTALETAANAVTITDKNGVILWVNPAFSSLTGYAAEEVIGKTPRILKSGLHNREFYHDFWEAILAGKTWRGTFTNRRKNGDHYQDEHTITPVRADNGEITHFIAIMTDVTERFESERKLRESEERLETIIQKMTEGLILADFEGKLLLWNPAALQMHGFDHDGKWHRRLNDFELIYDFFTLDGTPVPAENWPLNRIYHGETVRDLQLRLRRRDTGWERVFSYNGAIVTDPKGKQNAFLTINDITERVKSEEHLRLLGASISNLNDIVLITEAEPLDEPGPKIVFANEAFQQITGYSIAEGMGKSPRFLQGEKTDRKILQEIKDALAQKKPIHRQVINYSKEGREYWLDIDIVPVFDSKGKCTHFAAVERDITEEKKKEEQLLWNTAFFEAQALSSSDGILIVDSQGKKILQNQRMLDLWNIPPEIANDSSEAPQLKWGMSQVKNPAPFLDKVAMLYSRPDELSVDELELLNGKCYECRSSPVRGKDGKYYGRIWAFRDISDRKKAESQISEQAAFLDKARDAILVRDLDGNIIFWNQGAERVYGWSRQEVLGKNVGDLLYSEPWKFKEINRLSITHGEWEGELQHQTKDGRQITIEARWTLIRDNEGQAKSVLAINTDVTEKKKIEAQFMRAQRMESIGTLAGGIAHDLNNILAPIMMSIDLLKSTTENARAKKILETIDLSAKRGADIVRQVLSFARGMEGERIEVQPKHLLKDLENIIRDTFPKDIRLRFSVAADTWTILGDPTQIHQILLNLCVNARDAMPTGGDLSVEVENTSLDEHYAAMNLSAKPGHYVKISVSDTGTGIPPELLDKIFEPFFTTKELNKGTGLGLSTVMAIVKSHEGTINVYSEPNRGTTFQIYLPKADGEERQGEMPNQENAPRGKGETILLVDDESSILTITGQTLEAFGYRVISATDGAEAIAIYAQEREKIAVVLTDMRMPVMDGPSTINVLERINPAVKIIGASGLTGNESALKNYSNGVKHFLIKPYTATVLLRTLRKVLDEP